MTDAEILAIVRNAPALDNAEAEWLYVARAVLADVEAKRDSYRSAWEQCDKTCRDLTRKVLPNIRAERDEANALLREAAKLLWGANLIGAATLAERINETLTDIDAAINKEQQR